MAYTIITRSAPPCPYCDKAKALLDSHGIEYTEYDLSANEGSIELFKEITHDIIVSTHLNKWGSVGVLPLAENEARGLDVFHSGLKFADRVFPVKVLSESLDPRNVKHLFLRGFIFGGWWDRMFGTEGVWYRRP